MRIQAPEGYLSMTNYAKQHGVSDRCINSWVHTGRLPYVKYGYRRYVKADAPLPAVSNHGRKRKVMEGFAEITSALVEA